MGTDRSFNRNQQKNEFNRVLGEMRTDRKKADEIIRTVEGVHVFEKPKPGGLIGLPADMSAEANVTPLPPPTTDELSQQRKKKRPLDATPRQRADGQIVCADIGEPPPGCLLPTHLRMGGIIYCLVPPGDYEDSLQEAFERGWISAINHQEREAFTTMTDAELDSVKQSALILPEKDPNPLSYKLRTIANEWGDYNEEDKGEDNDKPE